MNPKDTGASKMSKLGTVATIVEYLIGLFVILLMTAFTFEDFTRLLRTYMYDNEITLAKSHWHNDTLNLLNGSLCFELTGTFLVDETESNIWSPNITLTLARAQRILKNGSIFQLTMNQDGTVRNGSLRDPAVLLAIALVSHVSNLLGYDLNNKKPESTFFHEPLENLFTDYGDENMSREDYATAHDAFVSRTQWAHRLHISAVSEMCGKFKSKFYLLKQLNSSQIDICDQDVSLRYNGHILEPTHLCVPLPLAVHGITRDFTNYPVFISSLRMDEIYHIPKTETIKNADSDAKRTRHGALHVEDHRLMLEYGYISRSNIRFQMSPGKNASVSAAVDIIGTFKQLDTDSQCTWHVSQRECWLRCQLKVIRRECGCNPFLYKYLLSDTEIKNGTFCTVNEYVKCWNRTKNLIRSKCLNESCYSLCSFTKYNWQFERANAYLDPLVVHFSARSFFYVEYKQIQKTSSVEFLSQLGGIAGLYLGFSGWTIYTFVAFVIKTTLEHRRARKASNIRIGTLTYLKWLTKFVVRKAVTERDRKRYKNALRYLPDAGRGEIALDQDLKLVSHREAYRMTSRNPIRELAVNDTTREEQNRMLKQLQETVNQITVQMASMNARLENMKR